MEKRGLVTEIRRRAMCDYAEWCFSTTFKRVKRDATEWCIICGRPANSISLPLCPSHWYAWDDGPKKLCPSCGQKHPKHFCPFDLVTVYLHNNGSPNTYGYFLAGRHEDIPFYMTPATPCESNVPRLQGRFIIMSHNRRIQREEAQSWSCIIL